MSVTYIAVGSEYGATDLEHFLASLSLYDY